MRVLTLLSGGKDSVAAGYVALQSGFDIVGACSLHVVGEDSHMFHRPNSRWAALVAEGMGLEPFVRETKGEEGKELDDLEALLQDAKEHTDAEAVIVGAIASEYQRMRVERIGHRLGLKTFLPVWHKDPHDYMKWLLDARFHVRIVSVSAQGLGQGWLGRLITPRAFQALSNQSRRFRFHLAGEGGEYETLVVDGPPFTRRLEVDEATTNWQRDHGTWDIRKAHLGDPQERPRALPEE